MGVPAGRPSAQDPSKRRRLLVRRMPGIPAVAEHLPWKKKMEMEFDRAVIVRFSLTAAVTDSPIGDLHVILIPLENVPGQLGVCLKHRSRE